MQQTRLGLSRSPYKIERSTPSHATHELENGRPAITTFSGPSDPIATPSNRQAPITALPTHPLQTETQRSLTRSSDTFHGGRTCSNAGTGERRKRHTGDRRSAASREEHIVDRRNALRLCPGSAGDAAHGDGRHDAGGGRGHDPLIAALQNFGADRLETRCRCRTMHNSGSITYENKHST